MGNLFDLDDNLLKEEKKETKDLSVELKKARALCIRGQRDRALEIYNAILEEDFENEQALLGILRVHSENFRIYEGKQVEDDVYAIESMCPDIMDEEYLNYISKRNDALKNTKEEPKKAEEKKTDAKNEEAPKKSEPAETFDSLYEKARGIGEDDYDKAIALFQKAITLTDNKDKLKKAYYEIGELYSSLADETYEDKYYHLAIENYEKAKKNAGKDHYFYVSLFNIGHMYYALEDYETALDYYKQSAEGYVLGYYFVAVCYQELGDNLEASAYYQTFINKTEFVYSNTFLLQALYSFGYMHYKGNGVKQNLNVAKNAFQKLADLGDKRGTDMLKKL